MVKDIKLVRYILIMLNLQTMVLPKKTFLGPNYLAIRQERHDLIDALS
jgi:hypothetical protein